uniref:Uncharacterized protein n=1 Tax=Picea sitchensis TaxID=3332 RepID=D5A7T7_PICSI|nr:unknown [Picea sitchensis]
MREQILQRIPRHLPNGFYKINVISTLPPLLLLFIPVVGGTATMHSCRYKPSCRGWDTEDF